MSKICILTLFTFFTLYSSTAFAGFYMNHSLGYFLGASVGSGKKLILGTSFAQSTKAQTKGTSDTVTTITLLELGPRFHWYFSQERMWYISFTYNFSAKGTADVAGNSNAVQGTSIMASFGYHLKVSKKFAMGASLNYHSTTITSSILDSTET